MPECEAFGGPILEESPRDYPEFDIKAGDVLASCPAVGVVYLPPFSAPALLELLWPDEWSLIPPG